MVRLVAIPLLILTLPALAAGPSEDQLRKKPITTARGELGDLLKTWWLKGTAAGNVGDFYDNRDRAHSDLDMSPYPQLQRFVYSPDDLKFRRDWALSLTARSHVTFGNSSTSAPPTGGGSNVRSAYSHPRPLELLYQQYTHNNLYMYPEHRDHDPGHNGRGDGFGDLYPTNTPYLITSQGSSGSDQPFMRAVPFTLAAFRPEVKKKLVDAGLLMPTVQMIFRASNKHLKAPDDYLTGKAHPSVFEGEWVDPLKMVRMAHDITADTVPPMLQLKVEEETKQAQGRDYFDQAGATETLADTPAVIARIWRGKDYRRRLVVSAAKSYDLNKLPLSYKWVVLRGAANKVKITPRDKAGSVAEIEVAYHPRRPIAPGSPMESNRVDIGVFAHNGTHYSAPGFITFYSFDSEGRTYEKGRVLEVGYGMGEAVLTVPDYGGAAAAASTMGLPARLLGVTAKQRAGLRRAAEEHKAERDVLMECRKILAASEAALRTAEKSSDKAELDKARKTVNAQRPIVQKAEKAFEAFLNADRPELGASLRGFLDTGLRRALASPDLCAVHAADLTALLDKAPAARKNAIEAARRRLIELGIAEKGEGLRLKWLPIRAGDAPLAERLTVYEKAMIERYHATLLSELVFPGVVASNFSENFVDQRLTVPRFWRDVYRYDASGALLGWARHDGAKVSDFTADGLLVVEKDEKGRPHKARTVSYQVDGPPNPFAGNRRLKQGLGDEVVTFAYDGDTRRVLRREKVKE